MEPLICFTARYSWLGLELGNETLAAPKLDRAAITWSIRYWLGAEIRSNCRLIDPNLDKEATTNGPEAQNEGQDIRKER